MANVSTGPSSAASHSETAGPDSTSREPPATASATQPISGTWPVSLATAATSASALPKKCSEANSTANEGEESPSDTSASLTARRAAAPGSAASTRAPPAFTQPRLRGDCQLLAHPAVDAFCRARAHLPATLSGAYAQAAAPAPAGRAP